MTPDELRQWRDAHHVERARLAEMLHCSAKTVQSWEIGARNIPAWLKRALRDIERELAEKSA